MTHGPAMSTSGGAAEDDAVGDADLATRRRDTGRHGSCVPSVSLAPPIADRRHVGRDALHRHLALVGRLDEAGEQRMRAQRLGLELRMELHRQEPRMAGQLDDLDELAVERPADDAQAVCRSAASRRGS